MKLHILIVALSSGCCFPMCEETPPPKVFQESYLSHRQPSRDPSYPAMVMLRAEENGTYWEMPRHFDLGLDGRSFEWGKRYTVEITSQHNPTWQHTSRRVTAVISETEDVKGPFRLYSISAPFFGPDKRSFIDEKAFECAPEACGELDKRIAAGKKFDLQMAFGATAAAPLKVEAVEDPTCYNANDCTVREECCDIDETLVCVVAEQCPGSQRVGLEHPTSPTN